MSDSRLHIEKNTVQETLVIPLYARALCSQKYPRLFNDATTSELIGRIDYDFASLEKKQGSLMGEFGALEVAMRQSDLAFEVRDYLASHPRAAVVNLGCGLDNTGRRCDNGMCSIYNLDLPGVIKTRDRLLPAGDRERNVACDLNDPTWMDKIDAQEGAVFFAAGVFYYFTFDQLKALFSQMARRFPGSVLVFDACNRRAARLMQKTWIKSAGISDVSAYFYLNDLSELDAWKTGAETSERGYMLGYNDLRDPSVRRSFRLLARVADGLMHMRIVRMEFPAGAPT